MREKVSAYGKTITYLPTQCVLKNAAVSGHFQFHPAARVKLAQCAPDLRRAAPKCYYGAINLSQEHRCLAEPLHCLHERPC